VKQVLIRQGRAVVEEVPAPAVQAGTVLVAVRYSCISVGTEMSAIRSTDLPLWERARRHPESVLKVLGMVKEHGISRTRDFVEGQLGVGIPVGYSASGVVLQAGEGVSDLHPGDRVACAGSQCAYHAEVIRVSRNLAVPVPAAVGFESASTVALGAIAIQGVRRAQPTLGESFVVVGLGILGQLTAQILKHNGCRVIGSDLDPSRISIATGLGMDAALDPSDGNSVEHVFRLTDGIGADGVIITASSPSDTIVSTAFAMCRKKGRVVLVGDVGLNLQRSDIYQKELDFLVSTSYGPGRYDRNFEEKGLDYPVGYVRWTENRNMAEYLRLVAEERLRLAPLITAIHPMEDAPAAFERLRSGTDKPLTVLLSYPAADKAAEHSRTIPNPSARPATVDRVRIALVGAGEFARSVHLPNLTLHSSRFHLQAVVSSAGHNATSVAKQFRAGYSTTEYRQVLSDPEVDAVLIATRHNLHAEMVLDALNAGKHVFVEKPLALTREDLGRIAGFFESRKEGEITPVLMTGFNRRFSPYARRIRELVGERRNPMILNYRMNAGYIPLDHWVHGEEGGGRNLGEACHVYDLFTFLTGSHVCSVEAMSLRSSTGGYSSTDNFVATMRFEDGSVASLTYTALGSKEFPKESLEIFVDGKVIEMKDYRRLTVHGAKIHGLETKNPEKGHREELEVFSRVVREGGEWPIPLWQQIQATEIALAVERRLVT